MSFEPATPKAVPVCHFFALCLLLATFPLWTGSSAFPSVPLFSWFCEIPSIVDTCLLGVLIALLCANLIPQFTWLTKFWRSPLPQSPASTHRFPSLRQTPLQLASLQLTCNAAIFGVGVLLVCLNQQRLQPWFYQLLLLCIISMCVPRTLQTRWFQALIISIYFYSSLGKFDFEFLHTTGQNLLEAILVPWADALESLAWEKRLWAAAVIPLTELMLAIGLTCAVTRQSPSWLRAMSWASFGFHLVLAAILCFRLQHSWSVILWNLQFAAQNLLLFQPSLTPPANAISSSDEQASSVKGLWQGVGFFILSLAMLLPLAERLGYWDHWLSWSLYSAHSSRTLVWIGEEFIDELPEEVPVMDKPANENEVNLWRQIDLAKWSLNETGAPIYPQDRFQTGIALALNRKLTNSYAIRVVQLSSSNRLNGKRVSNIFMGKRELESLANKFWFNVRPREATSRKEKPASHVKAKRLPKKQVVSSLKISWSVSVHVPLALSALMN